MVLKTQCQILDALVAKFGEPFGWSLTQEFIQRDGVRMKP